MEGALTGRWYVTLECDIVAHGMKSVGWCWDMESSMQYAKRCSSEWRLVELLLTLSVWD